MTLLSLYLQFVLKIANQCEKAKAVLFRSGRYRGLVGPGQFWIIPTVDTVAEWIDRRRLIWLCDWENGFVSG
jgi:hypothetical protein